MFVVNALRAINITSLAINTMTGGEGGVKVYSLAGSYSGHEHSSNGWELVYDNPSVQMSGRGEPTVLDTFEVRLSSGENRSFYVWAEQKLVYKKGSGEGLPFVSDESLVIYEGIAVKDLFGQVYSPRVWSGGVIYKTSVL